jgi:uncharacterized protein
VREQGPQAAKPWHPELRTNLFDPLVVYVICVVFLATLIRSTVGFGEALVAVPLLALRIPITIAAPLAVMISVVVAAVVVVQDRHQVQLRSASGLIVSSLPGIPVGILLLARGNPHMVKLMLGALIVGFSLYSLIRRRKRHLASDHFGLLVVCGFFSGVFGGAYGMNGPPLAIYGGLRGWSPRHFRATLQGYFLPISLVGLLGYAVIGLWNSLLTRYFLLSLPGASVAILLGGVINRRVSGHSFFRIVQVGLVLVGSVLLVQAMMK